MTSTWDTYEVRPTRRLELPDLPGVYAVFIRGRLVYIGSTLSFRKRFSHYRNQGRWRTLARFVVKIAVMYVGDWQARERRLIARLQPPQNIQWNTAAKPRRYNCARAEY